MIGRSIPAPPRRRRGERGASVASALALVAALAAAGLSAAVLLPTWLVVQVHTVDGPDVFLPLPVGLAGTLVSLAPDLRASDLGGLEELDELPIERGALTRLAVELERCPDAVLVDVRDRDSRVIVSKREGRIEVLVATPDESVHVALPLAAVNDALASIEGDRVDLHRALAWLGDLDGELVDVRSADGTRVRIAAF